ncbi:MAG: hypothetical protein ABSH11_14450 [Verrucomicrobiota bacterium]|jgi:hypothetical protein
MKTFVWLLTLAFVVICISCWALTSLSLHVLSEMKVTLPHVTIALLHPNTWILYCPVPWVIYSAVLSFQKEVTPSSALFFAGTLFFALALVVCAVAIAGIIPWIAIHSFV